MNCPTRGYHTIRHNELRNFTAFLLSEVYHDVSIEPHLQPLTGEQFSLASANVEDGARLDVAAKTFWGSHHQRAFLMLRYLTHMHRVTEALIDRQHIVSWRRRSRNNMNSVFRLAE